MTRRLQSTTPPWLGCGRRKRTPRSKRGEKEIEERACERRRGCVGVRGRDLSRRRGQARKSTPPPVGHTINWPPSIGNDDE